MNPRSMVPDSRIAVAYDVSILGAVPAGARAGIYRATLNTARGLARTDGCRLYMTVTQSGILPWHIRKALIAELSADPVLASLPTPWIGSQQRLDRLMLNFARPANPTFVKRIYNLYRRAARLLRREGAIDPSLLEKCDVFHTPFYPHPEPVLTSGKPRFTTVYDLIPILCPQYSIPRFTRQMHDWLGRLTRDDWVICISQYTRQALCERYPVDPAKVSVAHLAADAELFRPVTDEGEATEVRLRHGIGDWPYLLTVSTFEPRKNLDRVIRCFARLVRERRIGDTRLVMVGGRGWKYDHILQALSGDDQAAQRIVLTGYVADQDMAAIYSGAAAFIFTSLTEGFGLPALEAMSCGAPVISSSTTSLPEVVGDAGILIEPTDDDAHCDAMRRVIDDDALRQRMAQQSLAQAQRFSWSRCARQTLEAYRRSLSPNPGSRDPS